MDDPLTLPNVPLTLTGDPTPPTNIARPECRSSSGFGSSGTHLLDAAEPLLRKRRERLG
jgi:hypothetical protein